MATYFLRSRHLSRGKGARVTRAAAYRAGERIRDTQTSQVYDHSDRTDVVYKEVVIPTDLASRADMGWTQDRSVLWNAAEHAGLRRNSRLAREWLVFLPSELTPAQREQLVHSFARELSDKYRCAVDLAVHLPRPSADQRNHHAHLLMTLREVSPDGFGRRTSLEIDGYERGRRGLTGSSRDEYLGLRERWAQLTNQALKSAGLPDRVDHRSLAQQGIDREPTLSMPEKVFYAERRSGVRSAAGDEIRARYRERVEARKKGPTELARVLQKQKGEIRQRMLEDRARRQSEMAAIKRRPFTREEINERRREKYRAKRAVERLDTVQEEKKRAAARARYYALKQRNPDAIRQYRRRYRAEHAAEINANQRRYRRENSESLNLKRREYRRANAAEENRKQREYKQRRRMQNLLRSPSPTANESAQRWKQYRESQGTGISAEDSVRNWLAFREKDGESGPSPAVPPSHPEQRSHDLPDQGDDADQKRRPHQDQDLEF